jgi:hypothetical protein
MKIGVRWAKGLLKVEAEPSMSVNALTQKISEIIKIKPMYCVLYRSMNNSEFIDKIRGPLTLEQEGIKNGDIIFLNVTNMSLVSKDIQVAQMAMKSDVIDEYVKDGEKIPESLKSIRREFGNRIITGSMHELRESTIPQIIYQTETSCYAIRVSDEALIRFQTIALQENFKNHRVIFLFGCADETTGKTTIHCGMEPPQRNFEDHFEISDEFDDYFLIKIARLFGMRFLGMAVSHGGSDRLPMPSYLIRIAAKYQNRYGELFTTLVLLPHRTNDIEVVAYQITDAVVNLSKMGLLTDDPDPQNIHFKVDKQVRGVRVFGKLMQKCDVNLCICSVRIRKTHSKIPSHCFPSLNANPTKIDVQNYFKDNSNCPIWRRFFDFNLIVYLVYSQAINIDCAERVVKCIIKMEDIPRQILEDVELFSGHSF